MTLRLGLFANITHASALVGVDRHLFADKLGADTRLVVRSFNAGPAAVEALFSGAIDATYIGPNPAINAFIRSHGKAVRIVSGATSGGASLVVKPGVTDASQLKGTKLAAPQLGGTQDVALRAWLRAKGLRTDRFGGGDVAIVSQDNAQTLATFRSGAIAGAWVPEPWATRLVTEGHGTVLVDERSLWPSARFATTTLVVSTRFLRQHRDVVKRLLEGQVAANDYVNADPAGGRAAVVDEIAAITGKRLPDTLVAAAWPRLAFTNDPIAESLAKAAADAEAAGFLPSADVAGIYDLSMLNEVLTAAGHPTIPTP